MLLPIVDGACIDNVCLHDGICNVENGDAVCTCGSDYTGSNCESSLSTGTEGLDTVTLILIILICVFVVAVIVAVVAIVLKKANEESSSKNTVSDTESQPGNGTSWYPGYKPRNYPSH